MDGRVQDRCWHIGSLQAQERDTSPVGVTWNGAPVPTQLSVTVLLPTGQVPSGRASPGGGRLPLHEGPQRQPAGVSAEALRGPGLSPLPGGNMCGSEHRPPTWHLVARGSKAGWGPRGQAQSALPVGQGPQDPGGGQEEAELLRSAHFRIAGVGWGGLWAPFSCRGRPMCRRVRGRASVAPGVRRPQRSPPAQGGGTLVVPHAAGRMCASSAAQVGSARVSPRPLARGCSFSGRMPGAAALRHRAHSAVTAKFRSRKSIAQCPSAVTVSRVTLRPAP